MDPPEAQEGSRERQKGRGEFNTVSGPILGPKMEPKWDPTGVSKGKGKSVISDASWGSFGRPLGGMWWPDRLI